MRILVSAYACEPGMGSEPGVGWRWARIVSSFAEVTVLTRANNREAIEQAAESEPWVQTVDWLYHDLPSPVCWLKRRLGLVQLYYVVWQYSALPVIRRVLRSKDFDLVHHLTFGSYWMPLMVAWVKRPVVLGPVGGAESAPVSFASARLSALVFELSRGVVRRIAEWEPSVRRGVKRSVVAIAKADETAVRLNKLGARRVVVHSEVVLDDSDLSLTGIGQRDASLLELLSVGRLEQFKGYHLALRALSLARDRMPPFRYTIVGDGSQRHSLESLAARLGLKDVVVFAGYQPRTSVLSRLPSADIFIHPSLHDSGGWACVEAMAASLPVVCLRIGGPAVQVDDDTGIRVEAKRPRRTIEDMSEALVLLGNEPSIRTRMGCAGRERVAETYSYAAQTAWIRRLFEQLTNRGEAS